MKTETFAVPTSTHGLHLHLAPPRDGDSQSRSASVRDREMGGSTLRLWEEIRALAVWLAGRKARQIMGKAGLRPSDIEDVRQHLLMYVVEHLGAYDSRRGPPEVYVAMLITTAVAMLLRHRRTMKHGGGRPPESLEVIDGSHDPDVEPISTRVGGRRLGRELCDPEDSVDTRMDLAEAMASLPLDLRALACLLVQGQTEASVARLYGRSRRQVHYDVEAIREQLMGCRGARD